MLALTTYKCIYHLNGWVVLYRISAGCCSIIVTWAFADALRLVIDDEPALFYILSEKNRK